MRISLQELFIHRQYINRPVCYYFDRKTYTICDINFLEHQQDVSYIRYTPLFQIDEESIQQQYIQQFMGKNAWVKFKESTFCFEEYMQRTNDWNSWWRFYVQTVFEIAMQWCRENHIAFQE